MEFWNNKVKLYNIESADIYSAQYLQPNYEQEKGLNPSQRRRLRNEWMKTYPKLHNLEYLRVSYLISQDYFESICQIPNLKGLSIKSSRISDFSSIKKLNKLEQLDFSGSIGIKKLDGLQNLKNLKYCVLDNFFGIEYLNELSYLESLIKLHLFAGIHGKKLNVKLIDPISHLIKLEELALDIKMKIPIKSLSKLTNLKKLIIPEYYHSEVKEILPRLNDLR